MKKLTGLLLFLCFSFLPTFSVADTKPLIFGVLNQQSPILTAEKWNPILQYLTEVTGIPLQFKMGPTVKDTDAMMGRGEFDFVYNNHNFQTEFDGVGYKPIARWAGDAIHGVIVVPADSPIRDMKGLNGKKVAFPSSEAFVAYAVPAVAMKEAGVTVQEVFAGNQDGAMAQLKTGLADAAGANSRFMTQYAKKENLSFREIYTSEAYAELPVNVHPRVPKAQAEAIGRALVGMKNDPKAAPLLEKVKFKGFDAAADKDYDNVRRVYKKSGQ
jgi:phosphonate transport system substrate-binding protein